MQIIEIPWESRNIGVQAYEINDSGDLNIEEVNNNLKNIIKNKKIFFQIKVCKNNLGIVESIELDSINFAECFLSPFAQLSKLEDVKKFSNSWKIYLPGWLTPNEVTFETCLDLNKSDLQIIKELAISSFTTDRFHLDPKCGKALADMRIALWVDDLVKQNSIFNIMRLKNDLVGFIARKENKLILGGLFNNYIGRGISKLLYLSTLCAMQSEGIEEVSTRISMNNEAVLNLYSILGFRFRDVGYCFHCWRLT